MLSPDRIGRRGQFSLEVIITLGFLLLVFILVSLLVRDKIGESSEIQSFLDARRIVEHITVNVNMISEQGPGYYRYFSLPSLLRGGFSYDVNAYGNLIGLSWDSKTWSKQTLSQNVTIVCLDKGLDKRNYVFNTAGGNIEIICDRPNLAPVSGSISLDNVSCDTDAIVEVTLENTGTMRSESFKVAFNESGVLFNESLVDGLDEWSKTPAEVMWHTPDTPGTATVYVTVDYTNSINESIESDNTLSRDVEVIC